MFLDKKKITSSGVLRLCIRIRVCVRHASRTLFIPSLFFLSCLTMHLLSFLPLVTEDVKGSSLIVAFVAFLYFRCEDFTKVITFRGDAVKRT